MQLPLRDKNRSRRATARGTLNVEREIQLPAKANKSRHRSHERKYLYGVC